eukprot:GHVN01034121.1.p1 GENE.GHVN01034121.1~~GHVN01034121.1.p1  ORF type:complete len:456 (+),score=74.15 GHVN01034121.1:3410-4777(+)
MVPFLHDAMKVAQDTSMPRIPDKSEDGSEPQWVEKEQPTQTKLKRKSQSQRRSTSSQPADGNPSNAQQTQTNSDMKAKSNKADVTEVTSRADKTGPAAATDRTLTSGENGSQSNDAKGKEKSSKTKRQKVPSKEKGDVAALKGTASDEKPINSGRTEKRDDQRRDAKNARSSTHQRVISGESTPAMRPRRRSAEASAEVRRSIAEAENRDLLEESDHFENRDNSDNASKGSVYSDHSVEQESRIKSSKGLKSAADTSVSAGDSGSKQNGQDNVSDGNKTRASKERRKNRSQKLPSREVSAPKRRERSNRTDKSTKLSKSTTPKRHEGVSPCRKPPTVSSKRQKLSDHAIETTHTHFLNSPSQSFGTSHTHFLNSPSQSLGTPPATSGRGSKQPIGPGGLQLEISPLCVPDASPSKNCLDENEIPICLSEWSQSDCQTILSRAMDEVKLNVRILQS